MYNIYKRGFTLIELLVVIAIIGILAGIVLASLGTARGGANDAKTQEQLSNLRTAMEQYYVGIGNGSYGTTGCAGTGFVSTGPLAVGASYAGGSIVCNAGTGVWAAQVPLTAATTWWCVDSTGAARKITSAPLGAATACAAS